MAGAASAQDAASGDASKAPAAEGTQAPAQNGELSMGEDPNKDPQVGQNYTKGKEGDWTIQCVKTDKEKDPCHMVQVLKGEEGNSVAEITIFRVPAGNGPAIAGANVIVPLETLLPAGVLVNVDGSADKKYPFATCTQVGCVARVGLAQDDLNALKKGKVANVTIRPFSRPDVTVPLKMSLSGFTAAFDQTTVEPAGN
ncbi:invasion associated locus B family protein [Pseudooceanicola sp. CBS1P-1]|uniref:Invasion associated locus B family protein n=2 Tax=Paracoccaceae TaxID=31989 RepID=A0A6L7G2K3_9RHOB|nr:invasion associated locus B family protein [Pseudooceanicola endophyticus]MXN17640.1 invasion associated locus B family protein [Pseudooceanicola albus]